MSAQHWPGDSGDVVNSLWPNIIADAVNTTATAALNTLCSYLGVPQVADVLETVTPNDMAQMLDGEYRTDPSSYTATARGTA